MPTDDEGNFYTRRIDLTDKEEVGERVRNARKWAAYGGKLGSAVPSMKPPIAPRVVPTAEPWRKRTET